MRIGRYEIAGELGREGAALLYRGLDPVIRRPAVVKALRRAALAPEALARAIEALQREARTLGALAHPNIVAIYEYGEDETFVWIARERVEGRTLAEHLAGGWRPAIERLPSVVADLLEALDHAHARGIAHGALSPRELLVSASGAAKLAGFGAASGPLAAAQANAYCAPERFEGAAADERADLYSAGAIVYEVLAGRPPFVGAGEALVREIRAGGAPPASTFEPRLPVTIDMVLARALARRPEARYRSAREMLQALAEAFPGVAPAPVGNTQGLRLTGNLGALRRALGAAAAPPPAAPAAPAPPKRPRLLLVDDEERVLNALRALLGERFEIETATSGEEALARLQAGRFHVLVSDQRMPGMAGVELLRRARALAPDTVRLLLTGYADLAAIVGSVNEGEVFRFLSKPWQDEALCATLAEAADVAIALEALALRPAAGAGAGALLVLGEEALAGSVRALARDAYPVHHAAHVEAALAVLAREEIGVLVCDLDAAGGEPAALLKALKRAAPSTQLVALAADADAETILALINEARILRFLKKPPNLALLGAALAAARERYGRLAQAPALARIEQAQRAPESEAVRSLLSRMRALGGRLAAALRA
ncbi:MAG: response regulator [Burkholderiales bacterium]|nr:response regulator [Burkholderiales bacterium]